MKLTKNQREAVEKLKDVWDLRVHHDRFELCSVRGKVVQLHKSTGRALRRKGLIVTSEMYCGMFYYELTQKGREI